MNDTTAALCCFCGSYLLVQEAAVLVVYKDQNHVDDESQTLYAHPICLRQRVVPEIVLLTELDTGTR
jgi:hypothetical protein